jgi:hypothetical protein
MKPPPRRGTRFLKTALWSLAAAAGLFAAPGGLTPNAPITDFRLPVFDAATGRKTHDLRGGTAIYHSAQLVELRDFTLRVLQPDGSTQLSVQSPKAMLHIPDRVAEGDETIHAWAVNYDLTGKDWRWEERENHLVVRQGVRVSFTAQMGSILK